MAEQIGKEIIEEKIRQVVATTLLNEVRDPRLDGVTIVEVRAAGDLQSAEVFWGTLGRSDAQIKQIAEAFSRTAGLFRTKLAHALTRRITPALKFTPDNLPNLSAAMDDVLARAQARDAALHAAAAKAKPQVEDAYKEPKVKSDALDD